jgi:hypothetical protein
MSQIIDLGKLRFHFAGDWVSSTTYEANDVVKYGGNVYVYTYGLKTAGNLPTDIVYWALMIQGFKFKGSFSTATEYRVGDGVAHGGKVYIAVLDSTNQTPPNATYWSQFADGIQYEGIYNNTRAYQRNDVVTLGGVVYIAKVDTTGNNPTNGTFWDRFVDGISAQSIYNAATAYVVGDLVAYGSNIYRCTANSTANLPTNSAFWAPFVYGFSNRGSWSNAAAYRIGEIVSYGGSTYQAKGDNSGVNPTTTATWDKIVYGFKNRGAWSTTTEYITDDVVSHGGNSYIALLPHASTIFENDLTSNKWIKFNSGVRWRGTWSTTTLYLKDDIVKDAVGTAYIATQDHTSLADFGTDNTAGKWTVFVVGGAGVLPAIEAGDTGKNLTIAADGASLDWLGATQSNQVFYVAPHGTNTVTSGRNVATPFASIKYACQQAPANSTIFVKTGTYTEQLPITIPNNVAIVGDNQRTVIVQPAIGASDDPTVPNAEATMFLMSDGSILNKMTFKGMTGWVPGATPGDVTTSIIKGVVVRLNPATPIVHKSPYVLECSAIGSGLIGALIDGSVHATGAKTMIFHGYTVITDNGIGYWVKDGGKSEIVSCFTYYAYFGYTASGGGFIRALNGNNSYGTWGATSRGFDNSETALTGTLLGQQLNFIYTGGAANIGDTVTGPTGTGIVTNVQYSADKVYVRNTTGTFTAGQALTFTSGATGTVKTGALENQKGFVLVLTGFAVSPKVGSSISLTGDPYSYVIQSISGTHTGTSSELVVVLAQEKGSGSAPGVGITVRTKYSQIRLTGHDFLSIGTGGVVNTNYPGVPLQPSAQGNEVDEAYPGRVYYVSTDQDGNFRVGEYFRIDQATGRATLNASAFDLAGLTSLKLGSIGAQLGETINEFSSDGTLAGNSNTAVPTEYAVKTYADSKVSTANAELVNSLISTVVTLGTSNTVVPSQNAVKTYVDTSLTTGLGTKQATLTSGVTIKTINTESLLGSGNITIGGSSTLKPVALGSVYRSDFPLSDVNWNQANTQSYGWMIQRVQGVAAGVGQFGLVSAAPRSTSLGGMRGVCLPFQVNADNSITNGSPATMYTNSSSPSDFSTCHLVTDNHSGGFYYAGNIPWPGGSHYSGYGYGLLNADNTAGSFYSVSNGSSTGTHNGNGQILALRDGDGLGWRGGSGGYSNTDSVTRIHQLDFMNPSSPGVNVQNPSANTSTTGIMNLVSGPNNTTYNTAVSGCVHWRNGSNYVVARVFNGSDNGYTDYSSGQDWDTAYKSGPHYGVALDDGRVIIYHGSQTWIYSGSAGNRTQVTTNAVMPWADNPWWEVTTTVPDGTNSWIRLSTPSNSIYFMQKWTINPSTFKWTLNWETETPLAYNGQSYMRLNKLPNDRLFVTISGSPNVELKYSIFNRSQFPA